MNVSCVIPCYNNHHTIRRAVQSVLAQTVNVQEIIIVDDGSNQKTKNILNTLTNLSERINIISQQNSGVSVARNQGVQASSYALILMLDADDFFHPTYLEKALPPMVNNDQVAMIMCGYNIVRDSAVIDTRYPQNASFSQYLFVNKGLGNGLFRKQALLDVGGYDEEMLDGYEDWELHIRLKKNNWEFFIIPEILFEYSYTANSRNKTALKKDSVLKKYIYLKYKQDYIDHYEMLITHFQIQLDQSRNTVLKREQSIDFNIGKMFLKPLRWVKRMIR